MKAAALVSMLLATNGLARSARAEPETWSARAELSLSTAALAPLGSSQAGVS
jgi:hypothetical protein